MARDYSQEIRTLIQEHLDSHEWAYLFNEEKGTFQLDLHCPGRIKNLRFQIVVNNNDYNVYGISPISADEKDAEQMRRMAEFICRANYGLQDGNFELDFRDGEIRYKTYVNCEGTMPSEDVIRSSIFCVLAMFSRYGAGILKVMFADTSAEEAVDECEKENLLKRLRSHLHRDIEEDDSADQDSDADDADENDDDEEDPDEDDDDDDGELSASTQRLLRMLRSMGDDDPEMEGNE